MGLTYSFTFKAAASVTAAELERFLKSVEADAKRLGFDPTLVFRATFATPEQREFARRIHVLLPVEDTKLQGVVLLGKDQAVNFDPEVIPGSLASGAAEVGQPWRHLSLRSHDGATCFGRSRSDTGS